MTSSIFQWTIKLRVKNCLVSKTNESIDSLTVCKISLESYAYREKQLKLKWAEEAFEGLCDEKICFILAASYVRTYYNHVKSTMEK